VARSGKAPPKLVSLYTGHASLGSSGCRYVRFTGQTAATRGLERWSEFETTAYPDLRFRAVLGTNTRGVRFERAAGQALRNKRRVLFEPLRSRHPKLDPVRN
jgi:hypothetical protein